MLFYKPSVLLVLRKLIKVIASRTEREHDFR